MRIPSTRLCIRSITLALAAFALFSSAGMVLAGNEVVNNCSNDTELRNDLQAMQDSTGGTLTFNCGSATITLTGGLLPFISKNTTINGGGVITIDGNFSRVFVVNGGATLTLNNLTISNAAVDDDGGAIVNSGTLNINGSKFTNNQTTSAHAGGAIRSDGALNITNSEFAHNYAGNGGALFLKWPNSMTAISGSDFYDNRTNKADGWGGAILVFDGASAAITSTSFITNQAGYGGAAYVFNSGSLTLRNNSTLSDNQAAQNGGALYASGNVTLTVTQSALTGNRAGRGGGIYNLIGTLLLLNSTLSLNSATYGGAIQSDGGSATLASVTLSRNAALVAGGILNVMGTANLSNVTLSGNSAADDAGGIWNQGGTLSLSNSTLSGNMAADVGGGLTNEGTATLTNVTLNGNAAAKGGSIYHSSTLVTRTLQLKNTIVANSPSGGNCFNAPVGTLMTSNNFNLSSDNTCTPYFNQSSDWNTANPNLGPLANNGGATLTHIPFPLQFPSVNRAIDGGSGCPGFDQRGITRPQGGACDIGAVEYVAGEKSPWLWLPLIRR